jgi:hypothetical protein
MLETAVNELKSALNVESAQVIIKKPFDPKTHSMQSQSNDGQEKL